MTLPIHLCGSGGGSDPLVAKAGENVQPNEPRLTYLPPRSLVDVPVPVPDAGRVASAVVELELERDLDPELDFECALNFAMVCACVCDSDVDHARLSL